MDDIRRCNRNSTLLTVIYRCWLDLLGEEHDDPDVWSDVVMCFGTDYTRASQETILRVMIIMTPYLRGVFRQSIWTDSPTVLINRIMLAFNVDDDSLPATMWECFAYIEGYLRSELGMPDQHRDRPSVSSRRASLDRGPPPLRGQWRMIMTHLDMRITRLSTGLYYYNPEFRRMLICVFALLERDNNNG